MSGSDPGPEPIQCYECGGPALRKQPSVCYHCGNPATPMSPLILCDTKHGTRLTHGGIADPLTLGPLPGLGKCVSCQGVCEPLPAGYGSCDGCSGAFPVQRLGGGQDLECRDCKKANAQGFKPYTPRAKEGSDVSDQARASLVPVGGPGLTRPELMTLWGLGDRMTRDLTGRLVEAGLLCAEEQLTVHGGKPTKRYGHR